MSVLPGAGKAGRRASRKEDFCFLEWGEMELPERPGLATGNLETAVCFCRDDGNCARLYVLLVKKQRCTSGQVRFSLTEATLQSPKHKHPSLFWKAGSHYLVGVTELCRGSFLRLSSPNGWTSCSSVAIAVVSLGCASCAVEGGGEKLREQLGVQPGPCRGGWEQGPPLAPCSWGSSWCSASSPLLMWQVTNPPAFQTFPLLFLTLIVRVEKV